MLATRTQGHVGTQFSLLIEDTLQQYKYKIVLRVDPSLDPTSLPSNGCIPRLRFFMIFVFKAIFTAYPFIDFTHPGPK